MAAAKVDLNYRLDDRFALDEGRAYLTGWDALVRLPLMQRQRDVLAGLNTAGYVTGYPGSPLGGLDSLFRAQRAMLAERHVHFEPGTNEDLAATAVWGTQYLNNGPVRSKYDGVFGMWYGKGPGVERSTDAMRTGSYQGVSKHGGVLALAGDDHHARSTVTAQQSETLFIHMHMPVLNPATVQEYIDFGLAGWALSRFASTWVGMICLNDTVDSAATVEVDPRRPHLVVPEGVTLPPPLGTPRLGGVGGAAQLEVEIRTIRLPAAQAFVRANGLDVVTLPATRSTGTGRGLGIIAAGKAYLDVKDALDRCGLSLEQAQQLGISIYKPAMTWPIEPQGVLEFVDGLDEVLVVEPKHPVIEDQVNRLLRQLPIERRPNIVGKTDEHGVQLIPEVAGLDGPIVARALAARIAVVNGDATLAATLRPRESMGVISLGDAGRSQDLQTEEPVETPNLVRAAGFCSGCPHNTSTKVPEGSFGLGGTGCHGMAIALAAPGRETHTFTHMGGEGMLWVGMSPFADQSHVFQNMGDGTYSHSGYLAVRAAVAAKVNMTFKILLNGYISMTGGQAIPGSLSAGKLAAEVLAEGAKKVVVVTDDVKKARQGNRFPRGVDVRHRDELISAQEELREIPGVTVLVYDQACAAELRRERKRGKANDPDKRVFIHETVCEGCGDCNVQSNCISVEPLDTDLGRKRTINQSSCNKDFTCLSGYCPSFVTLYGATPRKKGSAAAGAPSGTDLFESLPTPGVASSAEPYNIVIGGIGGGGVLTIGALLGMAAHLEGKTATVLNESGLAQKNGAVQSHVRVVDDRAAELSARVAERSADLVIGADIVVVAGAGPRATMDRSRTHAVVNEDVRPTVAFSRNGNLNLSAQPMMRLLERETGDKATFIDAERLAGALMGDAIYTNAFLLGYALQQGLLPVSVEALERAIELNGVAIAANVEALRWGRLAAFDMDAVEQIVAVASSGAAGAAQVTHAADDDTLDALIARRRSFLVEYQDEAYARRYETTVRAAIAAEHARTPGHDGLGWAVARNLFKLMAYKDEYEVARLYADPAFRQRIEDEFEGDFTFKVNLAPQLFNSRDARTGRAKKWEIPSGLALPAFSLLSKGKRLRGKAIDPFGRTAHRRAERARITEYDTLLDELCRDLTPAKHDLAVQLASLPDAIRGYDTVKDESALQVKEKERLLLAEFRA
ncbi:MAG: indolepyruvate ferredoxin oxidoreductase family protein [Acidimicrobiia bacterium]